VVLSEEERKARRKEYESTHKELRAAWRDSHKKELAAYYKKNKEKINKQQKDHYQKNKVSICLRTSRNYKKKFLRYQQLHRNSHKRLRLETLSKVDPLLKCAMCGCDDTRFLEINHIKGGGVKEHKKRGDGITNMIILIGKGKRDTEDLNLLCRACNSLDHLERVHGKTGLRVVWEKPLE